MRVILLGAGASRAACYPLASQLMAAVEAEVVGPSGKNLGVSEDWKRWQSFKCRAHGAAKTLLSDPNPEVALSFLDLCAESDTQVAGDAGEVTVARDARLSFLRCLEYFFQIKHMDDLNNRWRRDYLRPVLADLRSGDAVITFNWDTTIERTLYEDGGWTRWNPVTGYGFRKELRQGLDNSGVTPQEPLPGGLEVASEIQVLKLHGSVGWYDARGDRLYFSKDYFLNWFGFSLNGELIALFDPLAPSIGPERRAVWAYPSFLKRIRGDDMRQGWRLADEALHQAKTIEVWGYSLPESDIAARVLLNVLPARLKRGEATISVHIYGDSLEAGKARDRWRSLLEKHECVDDRRLG
ncbi:MAG: hypothetical protein JO071_00005 [Deltaproteobacteria bacterium]|nr:hypothetical protein [Deltaproteobacteria bacterium]